MGLWSKVSEQIIPVWQVVIPGSSRLRSTYRRLNQTSWFKPHTPAYEGTEITYDIARQLYRNDGDKALGGGFCKPIIDLPVAFMGLPTVTLDDADQADFLNECLHDYWAAEIQEMFRDAMRDSKTIVRIIKPSVLDPLMTLEEAEHCYLKVIPPEKVQIERNANNSRIIERAIINHRLTFVEESGNVAEGIDPKVSEHEVLEIITRDRFRFYDKTTDTELPELSSDNRYGFVPILELFNEWDAALNGGQSDLEAVQPFVNALHDLLAEGLQAHKYHSVPKLKFRIHEVLTFIKNNFPDAIDENTGRIKAQAEISWNNRAAIFLQADEDAGFIEATSVLGDTKILAEFVIDCICVASQTPEWAFMRVDSGSANSDRNAQTVPWIKKILRKRIMFQDAVQELCKMVAVINDRIPYRPTVTWDFIRADDALVINQALQQLTMALEVAKQSGEISDETYREMIRPFMPFMKNPKMEALDAAKNTPTAIAGATGTEEPVAVAGGPQGRNE